MRHIGLSGQIGKVRPFSSHLTLTQRVAGVAQLKEHQDHFLAPECHYIRRMVVLTPEARHEDEEEEDTSSKGEDDKLRIVVCMKKESSRRLKAMGQYLQTDIAFKRIMRYLEFELACKDRDANASES